MNKIKWTLLLICLTVSSGCKTVAPGAPKFPKVEIRESIVEQIFCDREGKNCTAPQSFCRQYLWNEKTNQYEPRQKFALKACNGYIGTNSQGVKDVKSFLRKMQDWINTWCDVQQAALAEYLKSLENKTE